MYGTGTGGKSVETDLRARVSRVGWESSCAVPPPGTSGTFPRPPMTPSLKVPETGTRTGFPSPCSKSLYGEELWSLRSGISLSV